jgi:hypothetical protein
MSYTPGAPVISTVNSTSTPLSGGATFTGTAEISPRGEVLVQSYADVAGTLYFDFSTNGTNWDSTFPTSGFACSASVPEVHRAVVGGRYFRVRYVNGGSAQATFRLGTSYAQMGLLSAPLNQAYALDSDSIVVRQSLPWLDIARSLSTGVTTVKKFGRNTAVGTSFEPIAMNGIYNTVQAASATTLRVKAGGNANDTAAGSGARSITLVGLDQNFAEVTETIATAGASASSATSTTFTRLYRAFVASSGTYASSAAGSHSAAITIENGGGGTDWTVIDATNFPKGQSEIGAYTIPSGYTGFVKLKNVTADSGKTIDLVYFSRAGCNETAAPYTAIRAQSVVIGVDGGTIQTFGEYDVPYGPYTGPCDIGFMGRVTAGSSEVSVEFDIFLVQS